MLVTSHLIVNCLPYPCFSLVNRLPCDHPQDAVQSLGWKSSSLSLACSVWGHGFSKAGIRGVVSCALVWFDTDSSLLEASFRQEEIFPPPCSHLCCYTYSTPKTTTAYRAISFSLSFDIFPFSLSK
jgi:hypothetical protein